MFDIDNYINTQEHIYCNTALIILLFCFTRFLHPLQVLLLELDVAVTFS